MIYEEKYILNTVSHSLKAQTYHIICIIYVQSIVHLKIRS